MADAPKILVTTQEGSVAGRRCFVTVWSNSQGQCMVDCVEIEALPVHKVVEWVLFGSHEEAYFHGLAIAEQVIEKTKLEAP